MPSQTMAQLNERTIAQQQQALQTQQWFQDLISKTGLDAEQVKAMLGGPGGPLESLFAAQGDVLSQAGAPMAQQTPTTPIVAPNAITLPGFTSEGFTPDALSALLGRNIDQIGTGFDEQTGRLKAELARRGIFGGNQPGSGLTVDPLSQLASLKAQAMAKAVRDAILANQEQIYRNRANLSVPARQQSLQGQIANNEYFLRGQMANNENIINANRLASENEIQRRNLLVNALNSGVSGLNAGANFLQTIQSPLSAYVSGVNTALTGQNAAIGDLTQQKGLALVNDRTGPLSQVIPAVAAAAGGGLGALASGIGGNLAAGRGPLQGAPAACWIAAEFYGWFTPEFFAARRFIFERWQGKLADIVRILYLRYGRKVAAMIRKRPTLKLIFRPLFDIAVERGK